LDEKINKKIEK